MSDKDEDNPFGSTPPEDPFGRKDEPPSLQDIWSRADEPRPEQPPAARSETWRTDPAMPRDPVMAHDPFAAPPPSGPPRRADGAIASLVLGILGLVLCPLLGPFAWAMGRKAEVRVDASGGALGGRGEATAGKILGIVACALMILGIVAFVGLVAVGSTVDTAP